jgi:hypothetical protein
MIKITIGVSSWKAPELRRILRACVFVLAATVVGSAATTGPGFSVDLAHWAANGGWSSQWSVLNTSFGPLACTLNINGPDGQPLSLETTAGTGSAVPFAVAPGGTAKIQAGSAAGEVQDGSSAVQCDGTFLADVTYMWMPQGVALTEVSVLPVGRFTSYKFAANAFTGIAFYDPTTTAATAMVSANDLSGKLVGSATVTVPALGKTTLNLNQLLTNLPSSFEGSVTITLDKSIEIVAIDVIPGANGSFVLSNVPVIGYNPQPSSVSGALSFLSGPLKGLTATFSISALSPVGNLFGASSYNGIATIGSSSGTVNVVEMNNGTLFVHFSNSDSLGNLTGAVAAATQLPDGSYSGSISVQAPTGGSVGTITVKPQ